MCVLRFKRKKIVKALGLNNLWILLEDLAIEIKDNIPGYFARITGSANVGNSRIGQLGQIALFDS